MPLTFCVAVLGSSEEPASVLGVSDVQLYQVLLLQVQQVLHRLVAVKQQGGGVLLQQQQQQQRVAFIKSAGGVSFTFDQVSHCVWYNVFTGTGFKSETTKT